MRAALLASKEVAPEIPVICQLTYSDDGRTVATDHSRPPSSSHMGAGTIGVNCSLGPRQLVPITIKTLAASCDCPISVSRTPACRSSSTRRDAHSRWGLRTSAAGAGSLAAVYLPRRLRHDAARIRALRAALEDKLSPCAATAAEAPLARQPPSRSVCVDGTCRPS